MRLLKFVRTIGALDENVGADNPTRHLTKGVCYIERGRQAFHWYTYVTLLGFPNLWFNSTHFDEVEGYDSE